MKRTTTLEAARPAERAAAIALAELHDHSGEEGERHAVILVHVCAARGEAGNSDGRVTVVDMGIGVASCPSPIPSSLIAEILRRAADEFPSGKVPQ